jgi:chlorite dismutase
MTSYHHSSPEAGAGEAPESPRGKQFVKFTFYRVADALRAASDGERIEAGNRLRERLEASSDRMLTRTYSTVGTRSDTDFMVWQVVDDLDLLTQWHSELLRSPLAPIIERPHSYLSMTMRSIYENPVHPRPASDPGRERLRTEDSGSKYLFVYPMVKTRAWYKLSKVERQRIMEEHIGIGHRFHGIRINTTYSYGLDDQEFVVAFEGDEPGAFLALVRDLRDSESSSYTERDTPMFTCRRMPPSELMAHIGLSIQER